MADRQTIIETNRSLRNIKNVRRYRLVESITQQLTNYRSLRTSLKKASSTTRSSIPLATLSLPSHPSPALCAPQHPTTQHPPERPPRPHPHTPQPRPLRASTSTRHNPPRRHPTSRHRRPAFPPATCAPPSPMPAPSTDTWAATPETCRLRKTTASQCTST